MIDTAEHDQLLALKAEHDATDDYAVKAQMRYKLMERYLPKAAADIRELYTRGMIPGARAIGGVTIKNPLGNITFGRSPEDITGPGWICTDKLCLTPWKLPNATKGE